MSYGRDDLRRGVIGFGKTSSFGRVGKRRPDYAENVKWFGERRRQRRNEPRAGGHFYLRRAPEQEKGENYSHRRYRKGERDRDPIKNERKRVGEVHFNGGDDLGFRVERSFSWQVVGTEGTGVIMRTANRGGGHSSIIQDTSPLSALIPVPGELSV